MNLKNKILYIKKYTEGKSHLKALFVTKTYLNSKICRI